jgi:hypothetical protein
MAKKNEFGQKKSLQFLRLEGFIIFGQAEINQPSIFLPACKAFQTPVLPPHTRCLH